MRPLLGAALAPLAVAAVLASAAPARAQEYHGSSTDWRRLDRTESLGKSSSTQQFTFELRFGQYFPEVDKKPGLGANAAGLLPYERVFGANDQFYFGLELDFLPLRIPYIGAIGPGLGWGYTHASAKAKILESAKDSTTATSFTIMPMHLSGVVRFDELMRRTGFPLVPYAKVGLGLGIWMGSPVPTGYTGAGGTWGTHFALGGMLALNFLDPRAAARLDETTGVNHAYLFGEFMRANLNGLGSTPTFYLGSTSWVVGLAVDL
ncbi:MAG: MXAN_2562 family outer membrane beta-barrel protein [Byssovorax sp.]